MVQGFNRVKGLNDSRVQLVQGFNLFKGSSGPISSIGSRVQLGQLVQELN